MVRGRYSDFASTPNVASGQSEPLENLLCALRLPDVAIVRASWRVC